MATGNALSLSSSLDLHYSFNNPSSTTAGQWPCSFIPDNSLQTKCHLLRQLSFGYFPIQQCTSSLMPVPEATPLPMPLIAPLSSPPASSPTADVVVPPSLPSSVPSVVHISPPSAFENAPVTQSASPAHPAVVFPQTPLPSSIPTPVIAPPPLAIRLPPQSNNKRSPRMTGKPALSLSSPFLLSRSPPPPFTVPKAAPPLLLAAPKLPSISPALSSVTSPPHSFKPNNLVHFPARPPSPLSPSLPSSSRNGSYPPSLQAQKPPMSHLPYRPTLLIVGCAFGGVAQLVVLGLAIVWSRDRKKKRELPPWDKYNVPKDHVPQQGSQAVRKLSNQLACQPSLRSNPLSIHFASNNANPNQSHISELGFFHGNFTYDHLVVATNGFSEENLLGEGGFGFVYKGLLPVGKEIAVKKLKAGVWQGERQFQAEFETVSRVHHRHLVSLLVFCITSAERLLVYEFVPNTTLKFHLHGTGKPVMEWETRLKIAVESAKGLSYLHEHCNPTIIHRDIKTSNILLDFGFEPKVSDFGLARSFSDSNKQVTHISTQVVGTFGYLAPEYALSGKVTDKSDVYSYGVILLELITGRPPISTSESSAIAGLVDWAKPLIRQALENGNFDAIVDPKLQNNYNLEEMTRMVTCAAACVRHSAWLRPKMSQIVHALEGHSFWDLDVESKQRHSEISNSLIHHYTNKNMLNSRLGSHIFTPRMSNATMSDCGI